MSEMRLTKRGQGRARLVWLPVMALLLVASAARAQDNRVTEGNYKQAEKYARNYLNQFVYSSSVTPSWIGETDFFWYQWRDRDGTHFNLVNPAEPIKMPLFDHVDMAGKLSQAISKPVEAHDLPIQGLEFTDDGGSIQFNVEDVDDKSFEFDLTEKTLKEIPRRQGKGGGRGGKRGQRGKRGGNRGGQRGKKGGKKGGEKNAHRDYSPDHEVFVFAMDHNLYYSYEDDEENAVALTNDGETDFSFGSGDEEGEKVSPRGVNWSEDSQRFYVQRTDRRDVAELYLVNSLSEPRPTLRSYKYSMPGEENVNNYEIFVFDRESEELNRVQADKWIDQRFMNTHWGKDSSEIRFVRRDRTQRKVDFCSVDTATGELEVLFSESMENHFVRPQSARYLNDREEFLWWSERSGWGHYYLYDYDGNLKHAVTSGAFRASSIVELDEENGVLYFRGNAREDGENPYYNHLYRVNLDGTDLTLLDPGEAIHSSRLSPSKMFVVDNCSRVNMAPLSVLRDADGNKIMDLEEMDLTRLEESGWMLPETFKVKAADGVTDIYGNLWKPFDFDPKKKYPIIAHVYPGPQTESVSTSFSATAGDQQLAQLGFIVIQIGNRGGSPVRHKAYQNYGYGNLRDYGLADKKAGIEQLAARHSWIDIDRVGIYGHSGGGFMTAAALLQEPYNDFFSVGVSSSGNHDNNIYNQNWSEQYHGLTEVRVRKDGEPPKEGDDQSDDEVYETKFEIEVPANHELAANLKGHLLLVHGDMDTNVHPGGTIRLVNALIEANKRFDMLIMPGKAHGYGDFQPYFRRMLYDYFTEHLMGDYHGNIDMFDRDDK